MKNCGPYKTTYKTSSQILNPPYSPVNEAEEDSTSEVIQKVNRIDDLTHNNSKIWRPVGYGSPAETVQLGNVELIRRRPDLEIVNKTLRILVQARRPGIVKSSTSVFAIFTGWLTVSNNELIFTTYYPDLLDDAIKTLEKHLLLDRLAEL